MSLITDLLNVSESSNRAFWFRHLLLLITTVIVVYFVTSLGLKSVIKSELSRSGHETSSYKHGALLDEIRDNAQQMQRWGEEYQNGDTEKFLGNSVDFKLDDYTWQAMKSSPKLLSFPMKC